MSHLKNAAEPIIAQRVSTLTNCYAMICTSDLNTKNYTESRDKKNPDTIKTVPAPVASLGGY
jgi:hypothetical protein